MYNRHVWQSRVLDEARAGTDSIHQVLKFLGFKWPNLMHAFTVVHNIRDIQPMCAFTYVIACVCVQDLFHHPNSSFFFQRGSCLTEFTPILFIVEFLCYRYRFESYLNSLFAEALEFSVVLGT